MKNLSVLTTLLVGTMLLVGCGTKATIRQVYEYNPKVDPMTPADVYPSAMVKSMLAAQISRKNNNPVAMQFFLAVNAYAATVKDREVAEELRAAKKKDPKEFSKHPDWIAALNEAPANAPPITQEDLTAMGDTLQDCSNYFIAETPQGVPYQFEAYELMHSGELVWKPEIPESSADILRIAIARLHDYGELPKRLREYCEANNVQMPILPEVIAQADICEDYAWLLTRDLDHAKVTKELVLQNLVAASELGKAARKLLLYREVQMAGDPDFLSKIGPKTALKLRGTGPDDLAAFEAYKSIYRPQCNGRDATKDQALASWRIVRLIDPMMFSGPDPAESTGT